MQMQIEKVKVEQLKAAAYNPRKELKPGDAEYEKLKRSITEFGYVEPVIWNKQTGNVVGGHQRLTVLKNLGVLITNRELSSWTDAAEDKHLMQTLVARLTSNGQILRL